MESGNPFGLPGFEPAQGDQQQKLSGPETLLAAFHKQASQLHAQQRNAQIMNAPGPIESPYPGVNDMASQMGP